jgi:hypothetical protein
MPLVATHSRPWLQFGLRTMLVIVTLFAIWLGWELKYIRDRKEAKIWLLENGGYCVPEHLDRHIFGSSISFWRNLLGDAAIEEVVFGRDTPSSEQSRFAQLFPEAEVNQTNFVPLEPYRHH